MSGDMCSTLTVQLPLFDYRLHCSGNHQDASPACCATNAIVSRPPGIRNFGVSPMTTPGIAASSSKRGNDPPQTETAPVRTAGLEPSTSWFVAKRSIQLNYVRSITLSLSIRLTLHGRGGRNLSPERRSPVASARRLDRWASHPSYNEEHDYPSPGGLPSATIGRA